MLFLTPNQQYQNTVSVLEVKNVLTFFILVTFLNILNVILF